MPGMIQLERTTYFHLDGTADISVKSLFSGKWTQQRLPLIEDQWKRWQGGEYIQRAMPNLTPDQREFLLTGATAEEWNNAFGDDEDDDRFDPDFSDAP